MSQTGLVFHEHFLLHDPGPMIAGSPPRPYPYLEPEDHVEHPRRVGRVKELLDQSGLTERLRALEFEPASLDDVALFHTREYIQQVLTVSARDGYGDAGQGARLSRGSFEIALLAVGGACAAVDAVLDGEVANSYALIRPPGHHAMPTQGMGFCLFGNVAIAVKRAIAHGRIERAMVLDWDVHHGNGTQAIFRDDPTVFFASLHQWPFYPGTGGPDEQDETTLNVPLAAGSGDDEYLDALDELVAPALARFEPELLLVSAGFDAHAADPLALMQVSENGFHELARRSAAYAPRVAAVLEGGYNLETLPVLVAAAHRGFSE
jgi:acetoin utilization deacetylase AcuC-like enzyme